MRCAFFIVLLVHPASSLGCSTTTVVDPGTGGGGGAPEDSGVTTVVEFGPDCALKNERFALSGGLAALACSGAIPGDALPYMLSGGPQSPAKIDGLSFMWQYTFLSPSESFLVSVLQDSATFTRRPREPDDDRCLGLPPVHIPDSVALLADATSRVDDAAAVTNVNLVAGSDCMSFYKDPGTVVLFNYPGPIGEVPFRFFIYDPGDEFVTMCGPCLAGRPEDCGC